ncbi:hypothetical protein [Olivibacter sitiensis]|nr:hypothetical protein [Olivibacter sitiensis]
MKTRLFNPKPKTTPHAQKGRQDSLLPARGNRLSCQDPIIRIITAPE